MESDEDQVDDADLTLMLLTLHHRQRTWTGLDWDELDQPHREGMIPELVGRANSVTLAEEGLRWAEDCRRTLPGAMHASTLSR